MGNVSKEQMRREMDLIRNLMYGTANLSDDEIIEQLQITEPTYRRYKRRIRQQYAKTWEKENKDNTRYAYAQFHDSLEYCYRINKKIVDDPNSSSHDKIEASKVMCSAKQQLAKLENKGPTFQPQLPNKVIPIDSKEITV